MRFRNSYRHRLSPSTSYRAHFPDIPAITLSMFSIERWNTGTFLVELHSFLVLHCDWDDMEL